jgi:hypothetical protein
MSITVMKQALEALEAARRGHCDHAWADEAITALRTAIEAAEEQEPDGIGWLRKDGGYFTPPAAQQDAVLAEREACAKVCEDDKTQAMEWLAHSRPGGHFAAAIRARGQA